MDKTRAGKGCGSCKALVAQLVEWAAGGAVEEDPSAHYYVPGIPMDKPTLMAAIRDRGPALGRPRCSPRWLPTAPRTPSPRWAWPRC